MWNQFLLHKDKINNLIYSIFCHAWHLIYATLKLTNKHFAIKDICLMKFYLEELLLYARKRAFPFSVIYHPPFPWQIAFETNKRIIWGKTQKLILRRALYHWFLVWKENFQPCCCFDGQCVSSIGIIFTSITMLHFWILLVMTRVRYA